MKISSQLRRNLVNSLASYPGHPLHFLGLTNIAACKYNIAFFLSLSPLSLSLSLSLSLFLSLSLPGKTKFWDFSSDNNNLSYLFNSLCHECLKVILLMVALLKVIFLPSVFEGHILLKPDATLRHRYIRMIISMPSLWYRNAIQFVKRFRNEQLRCMVWLLGMMNAWLKA